MTKDIVDQEKILKQLSAPFDPEEIEWRAGSTTKDKTRCLAFAYITSRSVMERLDKVIGINKWQDKITQAGTGFLCGISIYFSDTGEWVTKWDGADGTAYENFKGGITDAFKRAAVKWGIGRYLYTLPAKWVACEEKGKTIVLKEIPQLPKEALPDGYVYKKDNKPTVKMENVETQAEEPEEKDEALWKKAISYIIPEGNPLAGKTFEQALEDDMGISVLAYLAGDAFSAIGEKFIPANEEEKFIQNAAKYISKFA